MSTPPARMSVMVGEHFACIKITGRANFTSSIDFRTLITELRQKGFTYFVLDLSECQLMDSTFLGVLSGFGLKMSQMQGACGPPIELLNPNARIIDLLESLGVLYLFRLTEGPLCPPEPLQSHQHNPTNPTREEVTRACIEAHEKLMEINPANVPKFKEVTQFLAEDLKKLKARE